MAAWGLGVTVIAAASGRVARRSATAAAVASREGIARTEVRVANTWATSVAAFDWRQALRHLAGTGAAVWRVSPTRLALEHVRSVVRWRLGSLRSWRPSTASSGGVRTAVGDRLAATTGPSMLRRLLARSIVVGGVAVLILTLLLHHGASLLLGGATEVAAADEEPLITELEGAPTIALGGDLTTGISLPPGHAALTFDDGPHPRWTPLILDELDRLGVAATFFVVGQQVKAHPELAREIVRRGHEIGNHTHTHPAMGNLSPREARLQLDLARLALVNATGLESDLYRPPYSSTVTHLGPAELASAERVVSYGYTLVTADRSPSDFDTALEVDELVAGALPPVGTGAIITLHDGGGEDRSNTVEMIEPLVRTLRENGYSLVTVGETVAAATGIPPIRAADTETRQRAVALGWSLAVASLAERVAVYGAVTFAVLYVGRFGFLLVLAAKDRRQPPRHRATDGAEPFQPPVTIIVPVYNEAVGIEAAIRSIDATDWPDLEILVVDDGSTDDSAAIAEAIGSERVRVLRKRNRGKASALNFGIAQASHDILVLVDGDTILEPTTVAALVQPFADPEVGAVAGNPKIGNVTNLVTRLQVSEYLISSSLERRLLAPAGMITTIPGAVGAWRRAAIREAGYVSEVTLAEDTDLTVTLARGGWRVGYASSARAWTEAPTTVSALYRQRSRWTFGTLQVLWRHRKALTDRGAGSRLGRAALPYMFVTGYLLAALAPLMDLVIVAHLLAGRWQLAVIAWSAVAAIGAAAGLVAARLDGESVVPALLVPVQQFLFRPMLHAVSIVSIRRALLGEIQQWGTQKRVGGLTVGGVRT